MVIIQELVGSGRPRPSNFFRHVLPNQRAGHFAPLRCLPEFPTADIRTNPLVGSFVAKKPPLLQGFGAGFEMAELVPGGKADDDSAGAGINIGFYSIEHLVPTSDHT